MTKKPALEPYPHHVHVSAHGTALARADAGLLLRHGYAPDIYLAPADVTEALLKPSRTTAPAPDGTEAVRRFDAVLGDQRIENVVWQWQDESRFPDLLSWFSFDFSKVTLEVDGQRVRGHVRDPHKVITVTPVEGHLVMTAAGHRVVDSYRALELRETGLPARFYVPSEDVDAARLAPSPRQTVCTYKGEAHYHHLLGAEGLIENAVWGYATPWTDFAEDIGRIAGHLGLYASAFEVVTLNGAPVAVSASDAAADEAMIASPTVDRVLKNKVSGRL